jgi:hypothetical protein
VLEVLRGGVGNFSVRVARLEFFFHHNGDNLAWVEAVIFLVL